MNVVSKSIRFVRTLLYSNMQSLVGFSVIPKCVTLNDLKTWFKVFCADFGRRQMRPVDNVAAFSVHKRSIIDLL